LLKLAQPPRHARKQRAHTDARHQKLRLRALEKARRILPARFEQLFEQG